MKNWSRLLNWKQYLILTKAMYWNVYSTGKYMKLQYFLEPMSTVEKFRPSLTQHFLLLNSQQFKVKGQAFSTWKAANHAATNAHMPLHSQEVPTFFAMY